MSLLSRQVLWQYRPQMKRICLRSASFWACLVLSFLALQREPSAQELPKTPVELLTKAANITDIQRAGMPPFTMRAKVQILGDKDQEYEGTFELLWVSPTQWREQLELPGYSRVRVGGDHKVWLKRNIPFEVVRAEQLDRLLMISPKLHLGPNEKVGKQERKREKGVVQDCVEINRSSGSAKRILCVDSASGALGTEEDSQPGAPSVLQSAVVTSAEYSDFHEWGGHAYPYGIAALSGKRRVVEFHVEELAPLGASNASLFQPPAGAEEWDTCDSPTSPVLLEHPQPKYPEEARRSSVTGIVQTYAVIETDGTLSHLTVVTSARPDMDRAALDAVSQWYYKPPTCNGSPVRIHTIITTTFWIP